MTTELLILFLDKNNKVIDRKIIDAYSLNSTLEKSLKNGLIKGYVVLTYDENHSNGTIHF